MFNLEQSIAEWRKQMLAAGVTTPVPLVELESHLRDDIEGQMKSGLDEQQAFHAAIQRIGTTELIQTEFEKVGETKGSREWQATQILFAAASTLLPFFIAGTLLFNKSGSLHMGSSELTSSLAAIATFSLLAWAGRLGHGLLPAIRSKRIRDVVCFCGVVLVAIWWGTFFNLIVPRYDFTIGRFVVAFHWAFMTPAGALLGLIWGIEAAARKKVALA